MAVTVKDILALESLRSLVPVAGQSGLYKRVDLVDMLDIGWERDKTYTLKIFDNNSFIISSLMFAKDDNDKLYRTLKSLIECGAVGLAYKPVFYNELSKEICRLADEHAFPIFRIVNNVPYREMICDITDAIRINKDMLAAEGYLTKMIFETLEEAEISFLVSKISPFLKKNAKVVLIRPTIPQSSNFVESMIRNFQMYKQYEDKVILRKYESALAIIVTMNGTEEQKFDVIVNNVLSVCGLQRESLWLAQGNIYPTYTALNQCLKEAYHALVAGQVLGRQEIHYREIGTLTFLIPMIHNPPIQAYMEDYLSPILAKQEYLCTAIAFIRAEGDYTTAAQALNYHKNTLRYRINKIQHKLSPELSYEAFYEKLSTAIKIHLCKQVLLML